jgi:hypothetical protein
MDQFNEAMAWLHAAVSRLSGANHRFRLAATHREHCPQPGKNRSKQTCDTLRQHMHYRIEVHCMQNNLASSLRGIHADGRKAHW